VKNRLLLVLVVLASGCSNEARPAPAVPSNAGEASVCVEIASACHEYEGHSATAKECHEMGHSKDATEEECQRRRSECLSECSAAAEAGADGPPAETTSPNQPAALHPHEH
jgi:hypothetical protein